MHQFLPAWHNCSDCAHCPREIIQIGTHMFLFLSETSFTRAGKKLKVVLNDCVSMPFKLCMQKQMKGLKLTAVCSKGDFFSILIVLNYLGLCGKNAQVGFCHSHNHQAVMESTVSGKPSEFYELVILTTAACVIPLAEIAGKQNQHFNSPKCCWFTPTNVTHSHKTGVWGWQKLPNYVF